MLKKGVYAATLSVLNNDFSLNVDATINHAEYIINKGLHGAFFFGSTGQSQLISTSEKKDLISKLATRKLKKKFYIGTGNNSLNETIELMKYSLEYNFDTFLIMPPAYYKNNTDQGVYNFYNSIIDYVPKAKIVLYNFEKLCGYKFSPEVVKKLVKRFPKNIIGCKDSSYNLFEKVKIKNFLMFPGSESKLLKGLELGCSGCISAITNVTHSLARKVFNDFENKNEQSFDKKLIEVRNTFDKYNLISALHTYFSFKDKTYLNLLPPLEILNKAKSHELKKNLEKINFNNFKDKAA
ncbi:MAG: dihydrodipicolinate synthase family protein [Pelagibacteraceae bacterium TMED216]|nr:MAG: dihydrodipicolinate synthase family protein [Pelagibacteraceae bacterium TMED216]|tara:strand:- start:8614 stop:9498 length:885 start_codon:yes stop_codon:yes gene_type:complete